MVVFADDTLIADASGPSAMRPQQSEANAALIAAAPELLEACKFLVAAKGGSLPEAHIKAKAAIDKAEGTYPAATTAPLAAEAGAHKWPG